MAADSGVVRCYFLTRDYQVEHTDVFAMPTDVHPLSSIHGGVTDGATNRHKGGATVGDPLTHLMEGSDPLSMMAALDLAEEANQAAAAARDQRAPDDWSCRRRAILSQFTTSQLVTITTRAGDAGADTVSVRPASRAQARLAQLEPTKEDDLMKDQLTQQEFIAHTGRLRRQLQEAWQADQRVRALKLVIQACKLLEDVSSPQFYPTVFVLVTDILDVFGTLVYNRVISKDREHGSTPAPPTGDLVSDGGRETCRNWFYKISSIRELVARLYVEMAVLKCYDLLQPGGAEAAARRLVTAVRGLADPLAAGYARCYLSRVAPSAVRADNVQDMMVTLAHKAAPPPPDDCSPPLGPAVDWCVSTAVSACAAGRRERYLAGLLERKEVVESSLLMMAVLRCAGAEFLSARAVQCVQAVSACDNTGYRRCELLSTLGSELAGGQVAGPDRLQTLNAAWRLVQELDSTADYMHCLPAWCSYVANYFGHRQLRVLLRDVVDHVAPDRQFEHHCAQLEAVLTQALADGAELHQLVLLPSFTALLELLQADELRHQRISRQLLQLLISCQPQLTAEPALLELGMACCQTLHDSVTVLSLDDERRETAAIITAFLRRAIDLTPSQLESSLDLLVQARGGFCNLEAVTSHLVQAVLSVADVSRRAGRRRAFSAACIAFCFITLPTLDDVLLRVRLYTVTAQMALSCRCPGQADACMRSAISSLPEIPAEWGPADRRRSALQPVAELVRTVLSALLVFPDQPSQPPLYLVRGLLGALDRLTWLQGSDTLTALLVDFLQLLSALAQPRYLYTVPGVDSNDTLYGGDPQLVAEINSLADDVIARVTSHLAGQTPLSRVQVCQAADLCVFLLRTADQRQSRVSAATAQLHRICGDSGALTQQHRAALKAAAATCVSKPGGRGVVQILSSSQ